MEHSRVRPRFDYPEPPNSAPASHLRGFLFSFKKKRKSIIKCLCEA